MVSYVQSLLANFVSAYYRITTWPPQKKNQLLLVSSTSRPNLLCFGFDLTQSQSSKPISRNGYGPNCVPLNNSVLKYRTCTPLERLNTSGSNSPSQPGKCHISNHWKLTTVKCLRVAREQILKL